MTTKKAARGAGNRKAAEKAGTWRRGWKVVDVSDDGSLTSFVQSTDVAGVIYKVGKVTRPKKGCGPLCIFAEEGAARDFCCSGTKVYPCLYVKSRFRKVWHLYADSYVDWVGTCGERLSLLPAGTVLANAVKLLPRSSS